MNEIHSLQPTVRGLNSHWPYTAAYYARQFRSCSGDPKGYSCRIETKEWWTYALARLSLVIRPPSSLFLSAKFVPGCRFWDWSEVRSEVIRINCANVMAVRANAQHGTKRLHICCLLTRSQAQGYNCWNRKKAANDKSALYLLKNK